MTPPRYFVRVESGGSLPALLLNRLPNHRRRFDPDLHAPHDLVLPPDCDDEAELARRSFSFAEARLACREWHTASSLLDVAMAYQEPVLAVVPAETVVSDLRSRAVVLRLLPLMAENGQLLELDCSVAAWESTREDDSFGQSVRLFRAPKLPLPTTLCAEVNASMRQTDGSMASVSARLTPCRSAGARVERFAFFERTWLESHFIGHDLLKCARVLMTPEQAQRLAAALRGRDDFTEVRTHTGSIQEWLGSGEFSWGVASLKGRFVAAEPLHCDVVGTGLEWVVWPQPTI